MFKEVKKVFASTHTYGGSPMGGSVNEGYTSGEKHVEKGTAPASTNHRSGVPGPRVYFDAVRNGVRGNPGSHD